MTTEKDAEVARLRAERDDAARLLAAAREVAADEVERADKAEDEVARLRGDLAREKRIRRAENRAIEAARMDHCHTEWTPECHACHIVSAYWNASADAALAQLVEEAGEGGGPAERRATPEEVRSASSVPAPAALAQPEPEPEDVEEALRAALIANEWPVAGRVPQPEPACGTCGGSGAVPFRGSGPVGGNLMRSTHCPACGGGA